MKLSFYVLFLLLFAVASAQQKQIDSLKEQLAKHSRQDTTKLSLLNSMSYAYYGINPAKGIQTAKEAIALASALNNQDGLATAYANRGHNYSAQGQDSLALLSYNTAIAVHQKVGNTKKVARLVYNKGLVYFNQSDYTKATAYTHQAYEVFKKENDSFLMAKMLNSIGINQMYLANYPKALSSYLEAAVIYEHLDHTNDIQYASIHSNVGLLYARLNKLELALDYQRKALRGFKKLDYEEGVANALTNIGRVFNDLGKEENAIEKFNAAYVIMKKNGNKRGMASALTNIGIAYMNLLDYQKALSYFEETQVLYTTLNNNNNLASVQKNMGQCYQNLEVTPNNFERALQYYNKALTNAKTAGSLHLQFDILEDIAVVNTKMQNYKEAYFAKDAAVILRDSFNSVEKKEEIARLEAKHKYDQEKNSLKTNYEREQALAETEVAKQKLKNTILASISLLILLSTLIGFVWYKKRQQAINKQKLAEFNAKVAETELKALRSQMNPHFIFNALNSISDYMSKNDVTTANAYLIKFAKLTRAILENSEKKWINLKEDLELTELYIQIESLRLRQQLSHTIVVSDDIDQENTLVPPMLLQPFIENSIWHGIAKKKSKGTIEVRVTKDQEMIICTVDDDGVGRENSSIVPSRNSMGVKITKNRLEIINQLKKIKGSIELFDKKQGVRVELKLPLELRF